MTARTAVQQQREVLEALRANPRGYKRISEGVKLSTGAISTIVTKVALSGKSYDELLAMTDQRLQEVLYPSRNRKYYQPDFASLHEANKKRKKPFTLRLMHEMYVERTPEGKQAIAYPSFCRNYKKWLDDSGFVEECNRFFPIPGEKLEIDYSGDTLKWYDNSGHLHVAHLFVAVMPYSNWMFVLATPGEKLADWENGVVDTIQAMQKVPYILVCDNAKPLVRETNNYGGVPSAALEALCEHYGMQFLACPPRTPTAKNRVEAGVNVAQNNILARLEFDGIPHFAGWAALNEAIAERMAKFNNRAMSGAKKGFTRSQLLAEELVKMHPLPATPFTPCQWKELKADSQGYITVNEADGTRHQYSVPRDCKGEMMQVRLTRDEVRIYLRSTQQHICTHQRVTEPTGSRTHVLPEHLSERERAMNRSPEECTNALVDWGIPTDLGELMVKKIWEKTAPNFARRQCAYLLSFCNQHKSRRDLVIEAFQVANKMECFGKEALDSFMRALLKREEARRAALPQAASNVNYVTPKHDNIRNNYR